MSAASSTSVSVRGARGGRDRIPSVAPPEAGLVEPGARSDNDAEGARRDLGIKRTTIACRHPVELTACVRDHAAEDIEAAGAALRVGRAGDIPRQRQFLLELDEIDATTLEDGALGDIDLVECDGLQPLFDGRAPPRKEARAQAVGLRPQAQIEAGGLDLRVENRRRRGHGPLRHQAHELLSRQQARLPRLAGHHASVRARSLAS